MLIMYYLYKNHGFLKKEYRGPAITLVSLELQFYFLCCSTHFRALTKASIQGVI